MCCNGRTRPLCKAVFFSRLRGSQLVAPSYMRRKMRETWRLLGGPLFRGRLAFCVELTDNPCGDYPT